MRNILTYQDEGSFGSILANIQITPALLGESLISLKRYACPPKVPSPTTPLLQPSSNSLVLVPSPKWFWLLFLL
ncbi:Hypothetical predicted protein, partial [Paramuricea clavata]